MYVLPNMAIMCKEDGKENWELFIFHFEGTGEKSETPFSYICIMITHGVMVNKLASLDQSQLSSEFVIRTH